MKLHRNARTTPLTRALLITRSVSRAGRSARRRPAKDSASAPRTSGCGAGARPRWRIAPPRRIATAPHQRAHHRRDYAARYEGLPAWRIAVRLQIPRSTVSAVLARSGLNRLARLHPPPPVQR